MQQSSFWFFFKAGLNYEFFKKTITTQELMFKNKTIIQLRKKFLFMKSKFCRAIGIKNCT